LLDAPWAFARGDHEVCFMYGTGWFYLMETNTSTACTSEGNTTSGDFIFPQQYVAGHGGARIDHDGLGASPCGYDGFDIGGTANNAVV